MSELTLTLADKTLLKWAQATVAERHYLHAPVDVRCSPEAHILRLDGDPVGYLIYGRPESTKVLGWFGSVEEKLAGKCPYSRWEVINLARVWLDPRVQVGGLWYAPDYLPGFVDRRGVWRSTLASTVIGWSLERMVFEYLQAHPPIWPEQPWQLMECLSYCDPRFHAGTLYRAAGFTLARTNERGLQTYKLPLRGLAAWEEETILRLSEQSQRSRRYRSLAASAHIKQEALWA